MVQNKTSQVPSGILPGSSHKGLINIRLSFVFASSMVPLAFMLYMNKTGIKPEHHACMCTGQSYACRNLVKSGSKGIPALQSNFLINT